jgi:RNA polymerase sigma-70 factor (ECF subfamily)
MLVAMALRDCNAYGLLVMRYEVPLSRYAGRLLGHNAQAVDDVLQEAFIKAYVNLRDYDRTRAFGPWIYRIVHNEAISFLRKQKTEPPVISGQDGMLLLERIAGGSDPNEHLARKGADSLMLKCLGDLGQRYRDVLVLRFLEEKSYSDIADILKLPPGTVATLIKRGLDRLRSSLAISGITRGDLGS